MTVVACWRCCSSGSASASSPGARRNAFGRGVAILGGASKNGCRIVCRRSHVRLRPGAAAGMCVFAPMWREAEQGARRKDEERKLEKKARLQWRRGESRPSESDPRSRGGAFHWSQAAATARLPSARSGRRRRAVRGYCSVIIHPSTFPAGSVSSLGLEQWTRTTFGSRASLSISMPTISTSSSRPGPDNGTFLPVASDPCSTRTSRPIRPLRTDAGNNSPRLVTPTTVATSLSVMILVIMRSYGRPHQQIQSPACRRQAPSIEHVRTNEIIPSLGYATKPAPAPGRFDS